jgi:hypothetical protein
MELGQKNSEISNVFVSANQWATGTTLIKGGKY